MACSSLAVIIARTFCEFEGKCWNDLGLKERHRYFYAGRMAQDRIREALLDGQDGMGMAMELLSEPEWDGSSAPMSDPAGTGRKLC